VKHMSKIFRLFTAVGIAGVLAMAIPAGTAMAARSIELDEEEGQIGDYIDVDGVDFPPSVPSEEPPFESFVDVYFTSQDASTGDDIDDEITIYELVEEEIQVDTDGDFSSRFRVPTELTDGDDDEDVVGGIYYVCVTMGGDEDIKAVAEYTVIAGQITLSPDNGVVGTEVDIDGENFAEEEEITIYWDGDELDSDYIVDCDEETDNGGDMTCTIIIPPGAAGDHIIMVTDESISEAEAEFTVEPSIEVSPNHAPPGDKVEVSGNGFDASEDVTISLDGDEIGEKRTDSDGSFTVEVTIPEFEQGDYDLEADDGSNAVDIEFTVDIGTEVSIAPVTNAASPGYVGQSVTLTGGGFNENAAITISFASTPEVVATTTSDANGDFVATFNIPKSESGDHTITASDGTNMMTVPFYIESVKPSVPALILPEDGTKAPGRTEFDWGDVTDQSKPVTYSLQVSDTPTFDVLILEVVNLPDSEYTLPEGTELPDVDEENPYYWRVRATDAASNMGDWSEPDTFHVGGWFSLPSGSGWLIHLWWGLGAVGAGFLGYYLGKRRAYYY